jgi:hypothetical protein
METKARFISLSLFTCLLGLQLQSTATGGLHDGYYRDQVQPDKSSAPRPPQRPSPPDKGMSPLSLPGEMTRAMIRN